MAEISTAQFTRADGSKGEWVEVTSSGLTHTCADGMMNALLCPLMTSLFSTHRKVSSVAEPQLYLGRNFGIIQSTPVCLSKPEGNREGKEDVMIATAQHRAGNSCGVDQVPDKWRLDIKIQSIPQQEQGQTLGGGGGTSRMVLAHTLNLFSGPSSSPAAALQSGPAAKVITAVDFPRLQVFPEGLRKLFWIIIVAVLYVVFARAKAKHRYARSEMRRAKRKMKVR